MSSTLIIYAHPTREGHNAHLLEKVQEWHKEQGKDYKLIDLYEEAYNPVLQKQEHSSGGKLLPTKETEHYQKLIKEASELVFIYPIWWGSMPAILKGFFDKVFAARFAFKYERLPFPILGVKARPVGLLSGKKAAVFMTSGSLRWTQRLFLRDAYAFSAKKLILEFCGIKTKTYVIGGCNQPFSEEQKAAVERVVHKGLRRLLA